MAEREYTIEIEKGNTVITLDFENGVQAITIADSIYDAAKKSGDSICVTVHPTGVKP